DRDDRARMGSPLRRGWRSPALFLQRGSSRGILDREWTTGLAALLRHQAGLVGQRPWLPSVLHTGRSALSGRGGRRRLWYRQRARRGGGEALRVAPPQQLARNPFRGSDHRKPPRFRRRLRAALPGLPDVVSVLSWSDSSRLGRCATCTPPALQTRIAQLTGSDTF